MTLWTVAHQAPLSMGFSGQECWSGLAFPPPEDLPAPGMEAGSPGSPALALTGGVFTTEPPGKPQAQTLLTGDMFTYITNRWPQALVSAKKKKKSPGQSCDNMNPPLLKTR